MSIRGKVLILATLHDTFPEPRYKNFVGELQLIKEAQQLKREVLLNNPTDLPVACEYMDRDSFDVVDSAADFFAMHYQNLESALVWRKCGI